MDSDHNPPSPLPSFDSPQVTPVSPPAGPPILNWRNKQAIADAPAPTPAVRCMETFGAALPALIDEQNRLYFGDNKAVLAHLLATGMRGRVRLIYIDPPFDSNADYVRKIRLRDANATQIGKQVQYRDQWAGDSYLQFMYERLLLLRDLLAEDGAIWLHCDYRQMHRLHLLLEEVFGAENYLNTVSWRSQVARGAKVNAFYFPFSTQYLEIFAKNRGAPTLWHPPKKELIFTRRQAAAQFMEDEGGFFRTSDPGTYGFERLKELHAAGRLYAPYSGQIVIDEKERRVYASNGGNIGVKYYLKRREDGRFAVTRGVDNLWDDIPGLGVTPGEDVGYPTQKTEALLRRVINASTNSGDWVLDAFSGSGTTAAVAQQMGRCWIACDANYGAIQTTRRRLQRLVDADKADTGFAVYGVDEALESRDVNNETAHIGLQIQRLGGNGATIGWKVEVVIENFRPADLEARLQKRSGVVQATDWWMLVKGVEIDPAYDGERFHATLVDLPHAKRAQVSGVYQLAAPATPTVIAVRITDIWGREWIVDKVTG